MTFFFAKFGFAMLGAAFIASFMEPLHCLFIMGILLFSVAFIKLMKYPNDAAAIVFAGFLGFCVVAANLFFVHQPAMALNGMSADIKGVVTDVSTDGGNPVFTVKTESIDIDGAPQKIEIRLSGWDENAAKPYDEIACRVSFITHGKDFGKIFTDRTDGTAVFAYTEEPIEVTGNRRLSFGHLVYSVREAVSGAISANFIQWHSPFMKQILIGIRGETDPEITAAFRQSGMSHILAISGMHMVILVGIIEKLFGYRKSGDGLKKAELVFLIAVVFVYMFVGGFGMSLRRAGIMLTAGYVSRLLLYDSRTADNLGIAVVTVLITDPFAACDVGFLMSAASCCAISVFSPVLKGFFARFLHPKNGRRVLNFVAEAFSVSLSAFFAVLPISAAAFGEVYPVAVLSNIFTAVFMPPIILLGFLCVIFSFVPLLSFLASGAAAICMVLNGALLKIAEFFSFGGRFSVDAESPWMIFLIFGCAVLIIAPALISASLKYIPFSLGVSFFVVCGGFFVDSLLFSGVAEVKVTALEHGTAVSCSVGKNSVLITRGLSENDVYEPIFYDRFESFVSLDSVLGGSELLVANRTEPKLAFFSDEDCVSRYENAGLSKKGTLTFSKDCEVEILSDGIFTVDAKEISLLYISEECDIIEEVKPHFRRADIIILDGVSPENFTALGCDYLILRGFYGFYGKSAEVIGLEEGSASFFGYRGNVRKGWLTE